MDGLLIDSESVYTRSLSEVLINRFNISSGLDWGVKMKLQGLPGPEASQKVIDEYKLEGITKDELYAITSAKQEQLWPTVQFLPGVLDLIKKLKAKGIPIIVCTSSHKDKFDLKTSHLQEGFELFELVITGDNPVIVGKGKPLPFIWWLGLSDLNEKLRREGRIQEDIKIEEVLIFEDAVPGLLSGKRAGGHVIWVPDPHVLEIVDSNELLENGAKGELLRTLEDFDYAKYGLDADDSFQLGLIDVLDGLSTQNSVRDNGNDLFGAVLEQHLGGLGQSTTGVCHIVDNDTCFSSNVSNENHTAHLVGSRTLFMDQRKVEVQTVGQSSSTLGSTGVGRNNNGVLHVQLFTNITNHRWLSIQVIHGHIKEPLNLRGVQVHRDHVVAPGTGEHIGHQFGRNRRTALVLSVLSGVREVWQHSGDSSSRRRLTCVDHDQQLQDLVVDDARPYLHYDVDILISNRLTDRERHFFIGITFYIHRSESKTEAKD
ncbi:hypothetical protein OGAPHI_005068 [Ogataea philodendri]|uniref:Uncharacterized protein n=1 Tax=Ogataea philodendri TaxID=1378263 RepID=A0A9P8P1X6_9ASCO|nr:uncharacterized protein OGAPHI_005068 [Ogataea philodendri]KAH3663667.1 hypothetical protein OGAPHI_005068 [Ogataea philodendri]